MVLQIKNMVCDRCKAAVQAELQSIGLHPMRVDLGEVVIKEDEISPETRQQLDGQLARMGFELLANRKHKMVDAIKSTIIQLVHYTQEPLQFNLSTLLSEKLDTDYQILSSTFSEVEHSTIEKYFIAQKIERVKELLGYGEQTLSEIANQLNYSSVAHLSAQFKKVTGITPSDYKNGKPQRNTLDRI